MCLIATAPIKSAIPEDHLKNAFDHNSDGWGFMFSDAGKLVTVKEKAGFDAFKAAWANVPDDRPVAVHFRTRTTGAINEANCHPFKVIEQNGFELALMHNGTLGAGDKDKSDTLLFVDDYLRPILKKCPGLIREASFRHVLGEAIGGSKLVLMEGNGAIHFINPDKGDYDKATHVWYSNLYSTRPVYRSTETHIYGSYEDASIWEAQGWKRVWKHGGFKWLPPENSQIKLHNSNSVSVVTYPCKEHTARYSDGCKACDAEWDSLSQSEKDAAYALAKKNDADENAGNVPDTACHDDTMTTACHNDTMTKDEDWDEDNVTALTETELFNQVSADPEGATDFIRYLMGQSGETYGYCADCGSQEVRGEPCVSCGGRVTA